jgi:hypothetical protein
MAALRYWSPLVFVTSIPVYAWLMLRWAGQSRAMLASAIYYTFESLYFLFRVFTELPAHSVWQAFHAGVDGLFAVSGLILAQQAWDNWRRRRKKKPARGLGRVGLRLGRLVVIPVAE